MTALVEAVGVGVRLPGKVLIEDVSLRIAPGAAVAMIGPNGAGKSTLLRVISGDRAPSSGAIRLKGRTPAEYGPRELALRRAVLAQSVSVAFPFSVVEVVRMGAGERTGKAIEAMIETALAEVDLLGMCDRIVNTLSGGEQQRAHFARVMVQLACGEARHGPGLLLLDEPTASLDLRHQLDLLSAARRCVARGVTVIAVLHDLNLAAMFADRILVLKEGRIVRDGAPVQTITESNVADVFGVASAINVMPRESIPFSLPHSARPLSSR
ncbi:heme ABC transporter ATP-binding protein [Pseudorhodoplanes sp.]|uniref:heme ABC transporter ATP-binding protein n=1 Tax=Pseudorhodoplanes sp. TaxID=1934341 RepID=UPI003D0ACC43